MTTTTTTTASLHSVTLKTVANYRHAAERTVYAYRSGGHRLIAVVHGGVDQAAQRGAEPYVPGLAAALRRANDNLGNLATQGLDVVSARTSRAIEIGADGVSSQLQRVADLADGVDNRVVAGGLQVAVRISLPGAQVALALSQRVAAGADKLADVAAGPVAMASGKSASKSADKRAKAASQRVRRSAQQSTAVAEMVADVLADVVTDVKATAKTASRRARAQAANLAETVTDAVQTSAKTVTAGARKLAVKPRLAPVKAAVAKAAKPVKASKPAKPANAANAAIAAKRVSRKANAVVNAGKSAAASVAAA